MGSTGTSAGYNYTVSMETASNYTVSMEISTHLPLGSEISTENLRKQIIQLYFWTFGVFLVALSVVGVVTNVFNIYALLATLNRKCKPIYLCLLVMAVADLFIMCLLLVRAARFYLTEPYHVLPTSIYTEEEGVLVDPPTYFFYNTWFIPANILMTISNWCTVSMGLFRLIAVFAPLKAGFLCTTRRVKTTLVLVCFASVLINLPNILELRLEEGIFYTVEKVLKYNIICVLFTVPVPTITVLVINIILIARLRLHRSQMGKMFNSHNSKRMIRSGHGRASTAGSRSNTTGETILIAVSMFYIVMSTPNVIYFIIQYSTDELTKMKKIVKHTLYITANLSVYISHACNFFFYVVLNKSFRSLLWKKVRRSHSRSTSTRLSTLKSDDHGAANGNSMQMTDVLDQNESVNNSLLCEEPDVQV